MVADHEMKKNIQKMLSHKRYLHSLGVENIARKLAVQYGVDEEKAAIAGLLHDCGKDLRKESYQRLGNLIDEFKEGESDALTHAYLSAAIAKSIFEVSDLEILSAIEKHTLGGPGMTELEKVIYLADFIEPGRSYPGMEAIKEATFLSLDEGLLEASKQTIRYLLDRGSPIHLDVVGMRNEILEKRESEE